jgi:hypothetical protein
MNKAQCTALYDDIEEYVEAEKEKAKERMQPPRGGFEKGTTASKVAKVLGVSIFITR